MSPLIALRSLHRRYSSGDDTIVASTASDGGGSFSSRAPFQRNLAGAYLARGDLPALRLAPEAALPVRKQTLLPQALELANAHRYADKLARR